MKFQFDVNGFLFSVGEGTRHFLQNKVFMMVQIDLVVKHDVKQMVLRLFCEGVLEMVMRADCKAMISP